MSHVATLIANPAAPAVTEAVVRTASQALPQAGRAVRLDGAIATDVPFLPPDDSDPRQIADDVRRALQGAPVDVVVQASAERAKRLFLADMDSTMIGQECIDELAEKVGLKAEVAAITERAMRGEIVFEPALRERVALLAGLPARVVDEVIAERIRLTPGARTLVATLRARGVYTCLVSGGFTLFTDRIAEQIGFDEARANRLIVDANGRLAGRVEEPILGADAKLATLLELRTRFALAPSETLAVGDGANDLPMLNAAGLGVAFRAKPKVAATAAARIEHGDLTALLYLQGISRDTFAAA